MPRTVRVSTVLSIACLALACSDLKTAEPGGNDGTPTSSSSSGSSGSSSTSSGSSGGGTVSSGGSTSPGATGPGPFGALPTGYCCTRDEDCRFRNCADVGGVTMCLDECRGGDASCHRPDLPSTFTCDAASQFDVGTCKPPAGFECIDPATFVRGTRALGDCCTRTGNGVSGLECEGGLCGTWSTKGNDNPFICTNACSVPADYGKGFVCALHIGQCMPGNDPYTCQ